MSIKGQVDKNIFIINFPENPTQQRVNFYKDPMDRLYTICMKYDKNEPMAEDMLSKEVAIKLHMALCIPQKIIVSTCLDF